MSNFPNRPALSAIVQQASLNRKGLVADCLFPLVKTGCKFSYIDWSQELLGLKITDDSVGCKTDVKEVDAKPYILVDDSVVPHALSQVLTECCVTVCGEDLSNKIEQGKTRQLLNKLLIGREKRAIDLAVLSSAYTAQTTELPAVTATGADGKSYTLSNANFINPNFNLRQYFAGVQNNRKRSGAVNVMITDRATLDGILSHPSFIGSGCVVDPITTPEKAAALLGVEKICIADASYNDGLGSTLTMTKLWPAGVVIFATSYEFVTSQDEVMAFGITAYDKGLQQYTWIDQSKGPDQGVLMQKISHDFTEIVLSYFAATKITVALS